MCRAKTILAGIFISTVLLASLPGAGPSQTTAEPSPEKSVGVGVGIGVASTVLPLIGAAAGGDDFAWLAFYSWLVGPFPGLAYAGDPGRGLKGVGFRLGMGAILALAVAVGFDDQWEGHSGGDAEDAFALAVTAGVIASWIMDIRAIPPAVREHNRRLRAAPLFRQGGKVGLQLQYRW